MASAASAEYTPEMAYRAAFRGDWRRCIEILRQHPDYVNFQEEGSL
jgi:hypothetical protein